MEDRGRFQQKISGSHVDGRLFRVVDALGLNYWVLEQTKLEFYHDSYLGEQTAIRKDYFYFSKPPSASADDYKGAQWLSYETENRTASRQSAQVANGIGLGFGIAVTSIFAAVGYAAISSTYVGKGIASTVYDGFAQLNTNGWKWNKLNGAELTASFFIQEGKGL
jgi:hypothetical protein